MNFQITWHDHNSTVSYRKKSTFFFVPEESGGLLKDNITSLNMIALVWNKYLNNPCDFSLKAFYLTNTKN